MPSRPSRRRARPRAPAARRDAADRPPAVRAPRSRTPGGGGLRRPDLFGDWRPPCRDLREDFCGTAAVCGEWVRTRRSRRGLGCRLSTARYWSGCRRKIWPGCRRAGRARQLLQEDVLRVQTDPVDVAAGHDFSYGRSRTERLSTLLRRARDELGRDGVLFLDAFGGYDAFASSEGATRDRRGGLALHLHLGPGAFHPLGNHLVCHIHFRPFPTGPRIDKAFT